LTKYGTVKEQIENLDFHSLLESKVDIKMLDNQSS